MFRVTLPLLMMIGCGETPLPRPVTLRALRAPATAVENGGVIVEAEAITIGNWKEHAALRLGLDRGRNQDLLAT